MWVGGRVRGRRRRPAISGSIVCPASGCAPRNRARHRGHLRASRVDEPACWARARARSGRSSSDRRPIHARARTGSTDAASGWRAARGRKRPHPGRAGLGGAMESSAYRALPSGPMKADGPALGRIRDFTASHRPRIYATSGMGNGTVFPFAARRRHLGRARRHSAASAGLCRKRGPVPQARHLRAPRS
jgi:hypothetical protein